MARPVMRVAKPTMVRITKPVIAPRVSTNPVPDRLEAIEKQVAALLAEIKAMKQRPKPAIKAKVTPKKSSSKGPRRVARVAVWGW